MHGDFERIKELPATDRRTHSRQPVRTLTYVELDAENGGIVLNASEGGLSVQAAMSLMQDSLPKMRFRLSQSKDWLETAARVVWTSESRKVAGLQFVHLSEQTRLHIRGWLGAEAAGTKAPSEMPLPSEREFPAVVQKPDASVAANPFKNVPASTPRPMRVPVPAPPMRIFGQAPNLGASPWPHAGVASDTDANRCAPAWNIAGLIAILAIVSLVAGWAAGRGKLNSLWENLRAMDSPSPPKAAQPSLAPATPSVSAPISQIDTVDIYNRYWSIPFGPPTSNNQAGFRNQTPQSAPSSTWLTSDPALAIPQIQSRSGGDAASQQPSPPAVGEPSGSAGGISLPSQSVDPREITPLQPAPQASSLRRGILIYHVNPVYPDLAREQGIQGTVELEVTIGTDGVVRSAIALSGPGMLIEAARSAVRRWRYTPSLLDGKPVESTVDVSVVFHLPPAP